MVPLTWPVIVSVLLGVGSILLYTMGFFGGNQFDVNGKTILLTGASEGMGRSVAVQLARKGANIVIVARNVGKLEEAITAVKAASASSSQRFHYISADVCASGSAASVISEAITWNNGKPLDVVWCIAGSAYPGLFIDTPQDVMRKQMDTNYWSCVDMAQAALREWLKPASIAQANGGPKRHLIFTSSVVAFYPVAGYAPYAPAKAAIKSLSDTLAQECLLYGDNVKVHTVFPGTISSPGLEKENTTKPAITHILEESDPVQTPEEVAAKAISGLESGYYLVTVGWLGALMKACAIGGSRRNHWLLDTLMTCVASFVWLFVGPDLDGKVSTYAKKNGHPSTYNKSALEL